MEAAGGGTMLLAGDPMLPGSSIRSSPALSDPSILAARREAGEAFNPLGPTTCKW